ncbi:glycosyltransferase family 4 protein [Erwinia psidii]|uniref:Glycosyltransferase family 4 protein n=1 Tax=Erwinia psidii TaxID=69224 RepID=A0A3N6SLQ5_9GAMM|nr:glycosyltransferase family 4 protein [Erwinia psidii]MCX8956460.1 glycosyltransferase family 4 protein [Erwinia psidii]MCX8962306.1 glycosyltransferase family 4 protein [Erwinia psidii]MCX8965851.1 glycosyltransferase family 4 protein [Erwinia psidii]RQM39791.1 glycosyltransferase family 4 protein [Erwinia psidii]
MKKIVLVIKDAYSYAGTENICNFMSECLGDEHEVVIYSLEGAGQPFYPFDKVKAIVSFEGEKNPIRSAVQRISQQDFDAVFLISMGRLSVMFALYSLLSRRKKKAKSYACEHIAINSFSKPIKLLKYLFLRYYDRVIVLTAKDEKVLTQWGIPAKTIPNPVVYKNYQRTARNYQALAVGRLDFQKGFDLLLDIWRDFSATNPQWKLVIAGDGELKNELIAKANSLNISDSVAFVGKVANINDYYRDSDMALMTSRYEGLPLVLLEAKSWSLPVVAYDCPTGPQEIINNNEDGFLVAMNDRVGFIEKMNQLAHNDDLFHAMSEKTKSTALKFDGKVIQQSWLSLI